MSKIFLFVIYIYNMSVRGRRRELGLRRRRGLGLRRRRQVPEPELFNRLRRYSRYIIRDNFLILKEIRAEVQ